MQTCRWTSFQRLYQVSWLSCLPGYQLLWAHSKASPTSKNCFYYIKERLSKLHLNTDHDINRPIGTELVKNLREAGLKEFKTRWFNNIHSATGPSGRGRNKLRRHFLFKTAFETEPDCKLCCGSLLLLVLAVRIYTLVQLLC